MNLKDNASGRLPREDPPLTLQRSDPKIANFGRFRASKIFKNRGFFGHLASDLRDLAHFSGPRRIIPIVPVSSGPALSDGNIGIGGLEPQVHRLEADFRAYEPRPQAKTPNFRAKLACRMQPPEVQISGKWPQA